MKLFFMPYASRELRKSQAWTCACMNVLATPGLGSILARRFVSGTIQLMMAAAGFVLLMLWFFQKMRAYYGLMFSSAAPPETSNAVGKWGLLLFAAAWIWSLGSSILLISSARTEAPSIASVPPKIP